MSAARVLLVSHLGSLGGAQRCLELLCRAIDRDAFELHVAVPKRGALASRLVELGIRVHVAPTRWWVEQPHYATTTAAHFSHGLESRVDGLARILVRERIELVLSNTSVIGEGALAAARCGVPHVWHVLEMLGSDPSLQPIVGLDRFYGLLGRLSRVIVAVSDSVRRELRDHCPALEPRVIHTGIDELDAESLKQPKRELFGVETNAPVVCFVGALSARKGVQYLVEAAPAVLARHPAARFVLAGRDWGDGRRLRRITDQLGLRDRVLFLGERSDAPSLMASADLVVLPSLSDPLPVVVLEAMALGRPVIATRSGGAEEMVEDGRTGLLVAPRSETELAAAVDRLLSNPQEAGTMGLLARQRARDEFSLRRYAAAFEELFRELLAQPDVAAIAESRAAASDFLRTLEGASEPAILTRAKRLIAALTAAGRRLVGATANP